jgi:sarcosine oxidase subunit beta
MSARTARELFPIVGSAAILHAWAGIEAIMPDELPVIGWSERREGLLHLCGFSGHGFELAPLTGRIVADLALGKDVALPLAPFAPGRFARRAAGGGTAMAQPAG